MYGSRKAPVPAQSYPTSLRARFALSRGSSSMAAFVATALLIAVLATGSVVAQATTFPILSIGKGETLPTLQQLQPENDWITLSMLPATIQVRNVPASRLIGCTGYNVRSAVLYGNVAVMTQIQCRGLATTPAPTIHTSCTLEGRTMKP